MDNYSHRIKPALKTRVIFLVLFSILVLSGCGGPWFCKDKDDPFWPDIDLSLYEAVEFRDYIILGLHFENIRPSLKTDYWELQYLDVQVGTKCGSALDKERCQVEFDTLLKNDQRTVSASTRYARAGGFLFFTSDALASMAIPPRSLDVFIVSNHRDENHFWGTREKILEFFGTIDSKEEAALLIAKDGFYGEREKKDGAVRNINGEYEFITNKNIFSGGKHYRINRYLLRVLPSGEVSTLREQLAIEVRCK